MPEPLATAELALRGAKATRALGTRLGRALEAGDFVGLEGELGAGKTTLVRATCEALGVPTDQVASPTFAIVYPYVGGRIPLHHADLYRLAGADELHAVGFDDLLDGRSALLVEWIDRIPEAAPPDWLRIELVHESERSRRARLSAYGPRSAALLGKLR